MVTVGIIAEFNPFHKGHQYIIEKAKKITGADNVVVVCSGNYVQRGEPAIYDKTIRTKAALANGVDAVFELPVYYSTASAETFARAGVSFLTQLNCVDYLCFGCEAENTKLLPIIADVLEKEPDEYKKYLKEKLQKGQTFPEARENAIMKYFAQNNDISQQELKLTIKASNSILAIEYIKAIKYFNSPLKPVVIKRVGAEFSSLDITDEYVSASAIRNQIELGNDIINYIPSNTAKYAQDIKPIFMRDFDLIFGEALLSNKKYDTFYDISEFFSNRIIKNKSTYTDIEHFILQIDSKNYTKAYISRSILHILLNLKDDDIREAIDHNYFTSARLLGINRNSNLLSSINDNSNIPIISKLSDYYNESSGLDKKMLEISIQADELYRLIYMTKYKELIPNEFERQIVIK